MRSSAAAPQRAGRAALGEVLGERFGAAGEEVTLT